MNADDAPPETLPILYCDDHLIAVDKPAGLLVHRTSIDAHETRFAVQILRDQIGRRVFTIHRLDKGTSGVLLFALSVEASRTAQALFAAHRVDKTYMAIVRGHPPETGRINHPLPAVDDGGPAVPTAAVPQPAVTHYRRLATFEIPIRVDRYPTSRYALLELHPTTGRRHQLRRHLKHIAHPIIGDSTYGQGRHNRLFAEHFDCHRLLLASTRLVLPHPASGETLDLRAPLAPDFARIIEQLSNG